MALNYEISSAVAHQIIQHIYGSGCFGSGRVVWLFEGELAGSFLVGGGRVERLRHPMSAEVTVRWSLTLGEAIAVLHASPAEALLTGTLMVEGELSKLAA